MQSFAPFSKSRKKVMICDDEQELLELYYHIFKRQYDVVKVSSGADCIKKYFEEKARGSAIDLLVLDYRLGDMFGDEVAKKIKEIDGLKVILISAYNLDNEVLNDLLDKKYIDNFLQKPVSVQKIMDEAKRTIC